MGEKQNVAVSESALKDTVTAKFSIGGDLRFLSHQETVSLFQRALVRSGVPLVYSEGFNPRPRLSLPFPRTVGLAAQEDMLCLAVEAEAASGFDCESFRARLASELPEGVERGPVEKAGGAKTFYPAAADYVFELKSGEQVEVLREKVAALAAQNDWLVERHQPKKGTTRMVNARDFVESAIVEDDTLVVRCRITDSGAIRVDELMTLFGIEQPMLTGAIVRRNVHWQRRT
jgi:radical SAM-linked protein